MRPPPSDLHAGDLTAESPAAALVAEQARRAGPLRFDHVVELALYHPQAGFYEQGGRAGRGGADFITSPEVGPLFGAVLARALDAWWRDMGRPDPYGVVEAGAGVGTLAAAVTAAEPDCAAAMDYVAVERSAVLREQAATRLAGRPVEVRPDMPPGPIDGVVVANELLDNLPVRLLQRAPGGWEEVHVDEQLAEVLRPAGSEVAAEAERLAPQAAVGARIPVQHRARDWLAGALASLGRGRVLVVDYMDVTASMAARPAADWLRTYRRHGRAGGPLDDLGHADITCDVAVDQLAAARPPGIDRSQADFLRAHGLDQLVDEARTAWEGRAAVGDIEALRWRSRVTEGAALTDPSGLGAFRALEWEVAG